MLILLVILKKIQPTAVKGLAEEQVKNRITKEQTKNRNNKFPKAFSGISQNVRGFVRKEEWIQEFKTKNKLTGNFHSFFFLQEAHLNNPSEHETFNTTWNRRHGINTKIKNHLLLSWKKSS